MDKTKQRIAIAKACGYGIGNLNDKYFAPHLTLHGKEFIYSQATTLCERMLHGGVYPKVYYEDSNVGLSEEHPSLKDCLEHFPDYLNDLNAMHEAEKVFNQNQRLSYQTKLGGHPADNDYFHAYTATAAQRAEAFLKTLDLWETE